MAGSATAGSVSGHEYDRSGGELPLNSRTLSVTTAFLCLFPWPAVGAQTTESDHAAVWVGAIQAFADRLQVPLTQVVVDSVNTGRQVATGPVRDRPRLVPVRRMQEEAEALGFHLMGDYTTTVLPGVPGPWNHIRRDQDAIRIFYIGQDISEDSAVAHVRGEAVLWERKQAYSDVLTFTFQQDETGWQLVDTSWETGSHRDLGVPLRWLADVVVIIVPGERREEGETAAISEGIQSGSERIVIKDGRRITEEEAGIKAFDFDTLPIESVKILDHAEAVETYGPSVKREVILVFLAETGGG